MPRKHPLQLDGEVVNMKTQYRYEYWYCPVNYVQPEHKSLIGLYSLFRQGKMLESGGVGDQPARYVDAMMFLDSMWNQAEAEALQNVGKGK